MWMRSLSEFIENSQDKREIQRALAVKMLLEGYTHVAIQLEFSLNSRTLFAFVQPNLRLSLTQAY